MKAYIAGIAGFLGSHLAEHLLAKGWEVVGCDDLSYGDRYRVPSHAVHWWEADATKLRFPEVDTIFNCAAHARTLEVEANPDEAFHANVVVARHCAAEARRTGARLVHASSCILYGPNCHYRRQKARAEQVVAQGHGDSVSLRFACIYGAHQSERGWHPNVLAAMRSDRDLIGCVTVTGDGSQTRDFIHVHDAARAMECAAYGSPLRFWYDICTGQQVSIREVAECFDTQIMEVGERKIDVREILMDPTFAAEDLGFKYEIEPLVGIREYARD